MKRIDGVDRKFGERVMLRRAWFFATATSVLITAIGRELHRGHPMLPVSLLTPCSVCYSGTTLYIVLYTAESLTRKRALEIETLVSL